MNGEAVTGEGMPVTDKPLRSASEIVGEKIEKSKGTGELKEEREAIISGERRLVPDFFSESGGVRGGEMKYKLVRKDALGDDYGAMGNYSVDEVKAAGLDVPVNEEDYVGKIKEGLKNKGWKIERVDSPQTRVLESAEGKKYVVKNEYFGTIGVIDAEGRVVNKLPWQKADEMKLYDLQSDIKFEERLEERKIKRVEDARRVMEGAEAEGEKMEIIPCEDTWDDFDGRGVHYKLGSVTGMMVNEETLKRMGFKPLSVEEFRVGLKKRVVSGELKVSDLGRTVEVFDPKTGRVLAHEDASRAQEWGFVVAPMQFDKDLAAVVGEENRKTVELQEAIERKSGVVGKLGGWMLQILREAYHGSYGPLPEEKYAAVRGEIDRVVDMFVKGEVIGIKEKKKIVQLAAKAMFLGLS